MIMHYEEPSLFSLLQKAKPSWGFKDVSRVRAKLYKVGISSPRSLSRAVCQGSLNGHLAAAGERKLKPNTLAQLKIQVRGAYKAAQEADENASAGHNQRRCFCNKCLMDMESLRKPHLATNASRTLDMSTFGVEDASRGLRTSTSSMDSSFGAVAKFSSRDVPPPARSPGPKPMSPWTPLRERPRERVRAASSSSLQQVGGNIAGAAGMATTLPASGVGKVVHFHGHATSDASVEAQIMQGGSQPSRLERLSAPKALRRVQSEPTVRKDCPPRPRRKAAPAAPAPFIARAAAPMVPGGMRHDDDALEDLLRQAAGFMKRGYVNPPRGRSVEVPGDDELETADLLERADDVGSGAASSGAYPVGSQMPDYAAAGLRDTGSDAEQAAILQMSEERAQADGDVKLRSVEAIKRKVAKANSIATCSTEASRGDAASGAPTSGDVSARTEQDDGTGYIEEDEYKRVWATLNTPGYSLADPEVRRNPGTFLARGPDGGGKGFSKRRQADEHASQVSEFSESQRSARTVDRVDTEGWRTGYSFINTSQVEDMDNEVLRFDGLLNGLDAIAASSVANSDVSPREAASFRAQMPAATSTTGRAPRHGNLTMDNRALERRARLINTYDGGRAAH
mmetsp:Transcript_126869/g.237139  ORF Transcript_126869/g.237139 Transcript_126869/m.237139 type:complete len:624 (-) Transcript_126869:87-1958(-)